MSVARIAALLGGALLAILVLADGLSRIAVASDDPETALIYPLNRTDAASAAADALSRAGQSKAAEPYARQALRGSLARVEALRVLGLAAEQRGDASRSFALMSLASRWGWRDVPTQYWILRTALEGGEYPVAVQHADALLRLQSARDPLFALLRQAAVVPGLLEPVVARLAEQPRWREAFFASTRQVKPEQLPAMEALLMALRLYTGARHPRGGEPRLLGPVRGTAHRRGAPSLARAVRARGGGGAPRLAERRRAGGPAAVRLEHPAGRWRQQLFRGRQRTRAGAADDRCRSRFARQPGAAGGLARAGLLRPFRRRAVETAARPGALADLVHVGLGHLGLRRRDAPGIQRADGLHVAGNRAGAARYRRCRGFGLQHWCGHDQPRGARQSTPAEGIGIVQRRIDPAVDVFPGARVEVSGEDALIIPRAVRGFDQVATMARRENSIGKSIRSVNNACESNIIVALQHSDTGVGVKGGVMRVDKLALALAGASAVMYTTAASAEPLRATASFPSARALQAAAPGARLGMSAGKSNSAEGSWIFKDGRWIFVVLAVGAVGAGIAAAASNGDSNSPGG